MSETPIASGVSFTSTSTAAPSRSRSPSQKALAFATFSGASRGGGAPSLPVVSSIASSAVTLAGAPPRACRFIMYCCCAIESTLFTKM